MQETTRAGNNFMQRLIIVLFVVLGFFVTLPKATAQHGNIVDMYPFVDSATQFPPEQNELTLICQKELQQRYISFVGRKGDSRAIIVAVTLKPLGNPDTVISTRLDFDGIRPLLGKVSTWGYIYDRNGDGKIDYLALVGGATAVKDVEFPDSFPARDVKLTFDQMDFFVRHCKIVYNHWADDNFDGTLDAVIQIDMDRKRDWVDRQIVVRSSTFTGKFDDVWAFRGRIDDNHETIRHSATIVPYHSIENTSATLNMKEFSEKTAILNLINRAAKECKMTGEQFLRSPRDR
jgi:hypothetical protein